MSTPSCPACKAKFQHDQSRCVCKACGLPDEVAAAGHQAISRWRKARKLVNRPTTRGGSIQRRRRAHGRPRGAKKGVR